MSRKNRNLEAQADTTVAVMEAPGVNHELEADLAHVKGELTGVLAQLMRRPDLQGGDGEVMAVRIRASLNGAVAQKPELGDAVQRVLAARWESVNGMPAAAAADTVVQTMRKQLLAATAEKTEGTPAVAARKDVAAETSEPAAVAVDENPGLTKLMGYIEELQAPDDAKAALRRDIGGLGKQLKDPRVVRTAKKAIAKIAGKNAGNDALIAKLSS